MSLSFKHELNSAFMQQNVKHLGQIRLLDQKLWSGHATDTQTGRTAL